MKTYSFILHVPSSFLLSTEEDGEADSFLGQNDPPDLQVGAPPPPSNQQAAPSTFSYFQQQQLSGPPQSDPFAGISSQGPSSFPSPQPASLAGPATIPTYAPNSQFASPPSLQAGPPPPQAVPFTSSQNAPLQPRAVHFQDEPSAGRSSYFPILFLLLRCRRAFPCMIMYPYALSQHSSAS